MENQNKIQCKGCGKLFTENELNEHTDLCHECDEKDIQNRVSAYYTHVFDQLGEILIPNDF